MLNVINTTDSLKLKNASEPQNKDGQVVKVPSFRGTDYERTEKQDNFNGKTENHTARNVVIGLIGALTVGFGIYALLHGKNILVKAGKEDATIGEKFKTGFENFFKKSEDTEIVKKFKEEEKKAKEEAEKLKKEAEKLN